MGESDWKLKKEFKTKMEEEKVNSTLEVGHLTVKADFVKWWIKFSLIEHIL